MRGDGRHGKRRIVGLAALAAVCCAAFCLGPLYPAVPAEAAGLNTAVGLADSYEEYQKRFEEIQTMWDIPAQGYEIIEKHVFDVPLVTADFMEGLQLPGDLPSDAGDAEADSGEDAGEEEGPAPTDVVRPGDPLRVGPEDPLSMQAAPTVRFFSAIDAQTRRAAIFLADQEGNIVYKCNQLECNYTILGELEQPITDIISVAFQDMDGDGLRDILLIAGCVNRTGEYAGKLYKVGEVLFQAAPGGNGAQGGARLPEVEGVSFYRDWRVNDKINRFDMNKSAKCIISFVRDGLSTEFLYTATTEGELLKNGFHVIKEQSYWRNYEKLGRLKVLPGVFSMSDYDIFMIYMINEQGDIVWSFQPMGDYDNLYSLRGVSGKDMDGDGMKDLLVVARYSREGENGELIVEGACSIYYQRTGGFVADTDFVKSYQYNGKETVEELIKRIRAYWGWQEDEGTEE